MSICGGNTGRRSPTCCSSDVIHAKAASVPRRRKGILCSLIGFTHAFYLHLLVLILSLLSSAYHSSLVGFQMSVPAVLALPLLQSKLFFNALPRLSACVLQQPRPSALWRPAILDEITRCMSYRTPLQQHNNFGCDKNVLYCSHNNISLSTGMYLCRPSFRCLCLGECKSIAILGSSRSCGRVRGCLHEVGGKELASHTWWVFNSTVFYSLLLLFTKNLLELQFMWESCLFPCLPPC